MFWMVFCLVFCISVLFHILFTVLTNFRRVECIFMYGNVQKSCMKLKLMTLIGVEALNMQRGYSVLASHAKQNILFWRKVHEEGDGKK